MNNEMNNENIRIEKLRKMLPKGFGAAIITTAENRFYFTGLDTSDAGTLIVFENDSYFIIDSRYIEICQRQNNGIVMTLQAKLYEQVTALLSKHNVKEVFLENKISIFEYNNFCKKVKANFFADDTLTNAIEALRMVKDEKELQNIFVAQEITDDAFNYILTEIKVGKTERELQLKLDYFMLTHGATGLAFDTILISGANTSLPHGVPSDKKIENGDFVTMDFGAKVNGYCTDMTRTVAVGFATDEMKKIYNIVQMAQMAGVNAVHDGCVGDDVDAAARKIISENGFGEFFGHATGHSVGIEIHENPRFSPSFNEKIFTNTVMTVEPGIYLPQKFGVRIEDTVIVKPNGCYIHGKTDKNLIIIK